MLEPERFHELPVEANPACSTVIVAEDEETKAIKAYWIAQLQVHVEPIWIDPEQRNAMLGYRMFAAMLAALNSYGIKTFYAFADRDEIADYLQRLGLKLTPFVTYVGDVPEVPQCLSSQSQPSQQVSLVEVVPSLVDSSPDQAPTA